MKTTGLITSLLISLALTASISFARWCRPAQAVATVGAPVLLVPTPVHLYRVRAARAGRVWEVYVKSGEQVRRGHLLAKLAVPLHSVEQQQREAALHLAEQQYKRLMTKNAPQAVLIQARLQLAEAKQRATEAPKLYTFVFVAAAADGVITGGAAQPGQYLADSSMVAVIAEAALQDSAYRMAAN